MITPDYLDEVVLETEDVAARANNYILRKMAERIAASFRNNHGDLFIPSTKADLKILQNAGMLYSEIEEELKRMLPSIQKEIHEAFMKSAGEMNRQNMEIAGMIIETEGLDVEFPDIELPAIIKKASDLHMTKIELRILENAYKRTMGEVKNFTGTIAKCGSEAYMTACDNAFIRIQTGAPINQVIIDAIEEASDRGVEIVTYGGRKTEAAAAIARAVRTGVNQANGEIVMQRCSEMGVDYVHVSEHLGARVTKKNDYTNHAWWQGKVYKLDWNNVRLKEYAADQESFQWLKQMKAEMEKKKQYDYPDFVETCGLGDIQGIMGANCRHSFYPFYPGINIDRGQQIDPEENKARYELTQKQRSMERAIRRTKRKLEGLKALKDDEAEKRKKEVKSKLAEQNKDYVAFCKDHGLKPRNFSLKI